jgi:hypothetical protein
MTRTRFIASTPIAERHAARAVIAAIAAAAILGGGCTAGEGSLGSAAVVLELACGGVKAARDLGVFPPQPPSPTSPPAGACLAATTEDLFDAVEADCPDIVLTGTLYEAEDPETPYLSFLHPTRLWAANPGSAVLRFGINIREHADSELHGLVIDIDDPVHGIPIPPYDDRNAVLFWGGAQGVKIHDSTIRGNGVIHRGINAGQPNGLDIERVVIEDFRRFGLLIPWADLTSQPASVTDVVVRRVGDPAWRALPDCEGESPDRSTCYAPGTQEHGIWIGFPTLLARARVREVHWAGIITGSHPNVVHDVVLRDVDVDRIGDGSSNRGGTAITFEKITHDLELERFCVGPSIRRGVHAEWDNLDDLASSAQRLNIHHGVISAAHVGLYFDQGTRDSQLRDLHIRNASWSGVGLYQNYLECGDGMSPEQCNKTDWSELTFDLPPGACKLTWSHHLSPAECYPPSS